MYPIGIDLGTTYSAIAKWVNSTRLTGSSVYQMQKENRKTLPSKVFVELNNEEEIASYIIGKLAIKRGMKTPANYISSVKRKMDETDCEYTIGKHTLTPVDISSEIIKHLLDEVEAVEAPSTFIPEGIVVTVPYYFKQHQNLRTKTAALKAIKDLYKDRCDAKGIDVESLFLGLLPEPIAAGLDYAFNQSSENLNNEKFLVFDLGGGTFDVTIFSLNQSAKKIEFEVLAIDGDDRLGGEDFDQSFFEWILEEANIDFDKMDDKYKALLLAELKPVVTEVKEHLAQVNKTELIVAKPVVIDLEVKRKDFESCINGEKGNTKRNYFEEIELKINAVLNKAKISKSAITSVLMIGGSSKIPKLRDLIIDYFGEQKIKNAENMDLAVAKGSAIYAAYKLDSQLERSNQKRKHFTLWDEIIIKERTAHKLGLEVNGGFFTMISDNALTPSQRLIPFEPDELTEDGKKVNIETIKVLQGNAQDYTMVGEVVLDDIYSNGRRPDQISINIKFTADTSLVSVEVSVPNGQEDGSDYFLKQDLMFGTS